MYPDLHEYLCPECHDGYYTPEDGIDMCWSCAADQCRLKGCVYGDNTDLCLACGEPRPVSRQCEEAV